jgi:fumarate hydratase subunit beta
MSPHEDEMARQVPAADGFRRMRMPMSRADARSLRAGDMILLDGEIVITAGLPTVERLVACAAEGRPPPIDLVDGSLLHLGSYSQDTADGGIEILYMNPTTSTRFNAQMPRLIRDFRLTAVGGKGGLDAACAAAMAEVGCVYLSFLGGGAPLHSAAITAVREIAYSDLVAHYRLVRLAVSGLGPVTVGIDSHGCSLFDSLLSQAQDRMAGILGALADSRSAI